MTFDLFLKNKGINITHKNLSFVFSFPQDDGRTDIEAEVTRLDIAHRQIDFHLDSSFVLPGPGALIYFDLRSTLNWDHLNQATLINSKFVVKDIPGLDPLADKQEYEDYQNKIKKDLLEAITCEVDEDIGRTVS